MLLLWHINLPIATTTISFYTLPVTSKKYPTLVKLCLRELSLFGYIYEFKCMFSSMNHIKK